jgi:exopolyphosphatase/pppGpp-phosphohydrolase
MRLAALDLGSNSFHALIADVGPDGKLAVVDRAKRMPRIGEGIFRTGSISGAARKSAMRALAELLPVIDRHRPDAVHAVATAAVRDASNGRAFVADVRARFGLTVRVISGEEEARLSYAGARARLGEELGHATLFDLGGGSLEAIVGDGENVVRTASAPLGVLRAVVERPLSDLIVHGIAMLDAILAGVGVEQARVCRAALREGLILEAHRARRTPARRRAPRRVRAARSGTRLPYRSATSRAARAVFAP